MKPERRWLGFDSAAMSVTPRATCLEDATVPPLVCWWSETDLVTGSATSMVSPMGRMTENLLERRWWETDLVTWSATSTVSQMVRMTEWSLERRWWETHLVTLLDLKLGRAVEW